MPSISLIATVLNEGNSIRALLDSRASQTRRPDEIVLVDGGSMDNTPDIIRSYADQLPIKLLIEPGCNISEGRNAAIRAASGEVIAATDAGVRLENDWLEKLTAPFFENPNTQIVAGFFFPDPNPRSPF